MDNAEVGRTSGCKKSAFESTANIKKETTSRAKQRFQKNSNYYSNSPEYSYSFSSPAISLPLRMSNQYNMQVKQVGTNTELCYTLHMLASMQEPTGGPSRKRE